jgi:general stress protein 26
MDNTGLIRRRRRASSGGLDVMHESSEERGHLQRLMDASAAAAGPHLRSIITGERRLDAEALCAELRGMRLLSVATVSADGRPLAGPVDGYFLHGSFWFSTSADSVRARHLRRRPAISATHLPHIGLAVSVHGTATMVDFPSAATAELRQAMLDHYVPLQGPEFERWLDDLDGAVAVRIDASKLFVFHMPD